MNKKIKKKARKKKRKLLSRHLMANPLKAWGFVNDNGHATKWPSKGEKHISSVRLCNDQRILIYKNFDSLQHFVEVATLHIPRLKKLSKNLYR